MNNFQRVIKYCAIALAALLAIGIVSLAVNIVTKIAAINTDTASISSDGRENTSDDREVETVDRSYTFEGVKSLDIDHSTGELIIKEGDAFQVKAEDVLPDFEAEVKEDGRLVINDGESGFHIFGLHLNGASDPRSRITVYLPKDFVAEEARIESGAGRMTVENLAADYLYISAGAGQIIGEGITAEEADIGGGVGEITLSDVKLNDTDFDNGVGRMDISGVLTGDISFDCGVGEVRVSINGSADDYDLSIDTGVGSVILNGKKVSEGRINNPSGKNRIKIDGGIGEVRIDIGK